MEFAGKCEISALVIVTTIDIRMEAQDAVVA
jgi:hypothetical protein